MIGGIDGYSRNRGAIPRRSHRAKFGAELNPRFNGGGSNTHTKCRNHPAKFRKGVFL